MYKGLTLEQWHDEFIEKLKTKYGDVYNILETYKGSGEKILVEHKCPDGDYYRWKIRPVQLLKGDNPPCPKCSGKYTGIEAFKYKVKKLTKNDFKVIGEYVGQKVDIKMRHECGYEFDVKPDNFVRTPRCPQCTKKASSKGEDEVKKILNKLHIYFLRQHTFPDCRYLQLLLFDFYLPEYNACIEFQGQQHYEPRDFGGRGEKWAIKEFELSQIKDQIKRDYCKENNIQLLEIPYWEVDNMRKIIKDFINKLNKLNKSA